jgi:outer membrane protein assembly factor BamE (lipoprotein component of BamABCDE complex)
MDRRIRRWFLWRVILLTVSLLGTWLFLRQPRQPVNQPADAVKQAQLPVNATSHQAIAPADRGHVTQTTFDNVQNGMKRDQVDALLGREHRSSGEITIRSADEKPALHLTSGLGLGETTYEEGQGAARLRAIVTFELRNLTVVDKELLDEPRNPGQVTEDNFARIRKGMTRKEVALLLGGVEHLFMMSGSGGRMHYTFQGEQDTSKGLTLLRVTVDFDHNGLVEQKRREYIGFVPTVSAVQLQWRGFDKLRDYFCSRR